MGGVPADGIGVVGAVDQDAVAEVERVLAEVALDEAFRRIGRRDALPRFDECPVGLPPHGVFDFAEHFHVAARRVELPDVVADLHGLAAAGRGGRLPDELAVAEEVDGVRGHIDGDDGAGSRRLGGQPLDRLVAFAEELPPVTGRLLLCMNLRNCCDCQACDE